MKEATFTIGPEDLSAANRLHFLSLFSVRRWALVFAGSALAITLVLFGLNLNFGFGGYLVLLGSVWGIVVAICVWGWLMIPRQARRTWKQAQKLWIETTVLGMPIVSTSNRPEGCRKSSGQPILGGLPTTGAFCSIKTSGLSTRCRSAVFRRMLARSSSDI
jgi:hypothetical protein